MTSVSGKRFMRAAVMAAVVLAVLLLAGTVRRGAADVYAADGKKIRILFIGNSVTFHEKSKGTWYGNWGMAATKKGKDYVHQTCKLLKAKKQVKVKYKIWNSVYFERMSNRGAMYRMLKKKLKFKPDVVVLQITENIMKGSNGHWVKEIKKLVKLIRKSSKGVKIVMLGTFGPFSAWSWKNGNTVKRAVCSAMDIPFIDVSDIVSNAAYKNNYSKVRGDDGKWHSVTVKGVAIHPNDRGMREIAERIVAKL